MRLPVSVSIGAQALQRYAVGDSIEARFKEVIQPQRISEACWMTTNDDECFRAAVGALLLSYGQGTPEYERIEAELRQLQKVSALLQAAHAGLNVGLDSLEPDAEHAPIGLVGLWHSREKH